MHELVSRRVRHALLVSLVGMVAVFARISTAQAATFNVGCGVNNAVNVQTLINAIKAANDEINNPGADTISLAAGCIYTLTAADNGSNGLPVVTSTITIDGNGATITRDSGAPSFRIFDVAAVGGDLSLDSLTASNGDLFSGNGGGILNEGTLTLTASTLSGNRALG